MLRKLDHRYLGGAVYNWLEKDDYLSTTDVNEPILISVFFKF